MSVVYIKTLSENAMLGLWHISESAEELLKSLKLSPYDSLVFSSKKTDLKKKQWLACRHLLKEMLREIVEVRYDPHGRPSLPAHAMYISMSHSQEYASVYLNPAHSAGVDIQKIKPSIKAGSDFFLNGQENEWVTLDDNVMLHVIWSAKESVFKYCGIPELDIKKDIVLYPFTSNQNGIIEVTILNQNRDNKILIDYKIFDGYVLTRTV